MLCERVSTNHVPFFKFVRDNLGSDIEGFHRVFPGVK